MGLARLTRSAIDRRGGDQLVQQFQPLRRDHRVQLSDASNVAAWTVKIGNDAELDRVFARFQDNWYSRRCCFRRKCARSAGPGITSPFRGILFDSRLWINPISI